MWDACDGLEPEGVATDDGVNMILETLADAFHGEHETELIDALVSLDLVGRGVRKSTTMHYGYRATCESWPSKQCGSQTK